MASRGDRPTRTSLTLLAAGRRLHGERVAVEDAHPEAPTLVFLHEGLGCIGFWKDVPEALCGRLGLPGLVWDRWGYGASEPFDRPRTPRYLHEEALRFLPEVLAAAGIEQPVLIGHSDGASIALLYAAAFPHRPVAVVSEAAHVLVEERTLTGIRAAVTAWQSGRLRTTLERFHGGQARAVFEAWAGLWLSPAFRDWTIEAEIAAVRAPLLLVQGEDDAYGTADQVARIAAAVRGPVATAMLPACGHVPHHEARERTLDLIVGFLDPILRREGVHHAPATE